MAKPNNKGRKVTVESDGYRVVGTVVGFDPTDKDKFIITVPNDSTQPEKGTKEVSRHRTAITWLG